MPEMPFISKRDLPFLAFSAVTLGLRLAPTRLRFRWTEIASHQLGDLWYRMDRSDASLTRNNMKSVLGMQFSDDQIDSLARVLYHNVAYSKLVNDLLPELDLEDIHQYLHLEGEEHLKQALSEGRGAILLATHFGLHGYSTMALLRKLGYAFKSVVADEIEPGDSRVYQALVLPVRRRAEDQLHFPMIKPNGQPQMEMIDTLRNNQLLLIFGDVLEADMLQMQSPHVLTAPFLGRNILLKTGLFRLAKGYKTPMLPIFIEPRRQGFALVVEPPLVLTPENSLAGLKADLATFTRRFEPYLQRYPALWAHWRHANLLELFQPEESSPIPMPMVLPQYAAAQD